jgi:hypothetical protein
MSLPGSPQIGSGYSANAAQSAQCEPRATRHIENACNTARGLCIAADNIKRRLFDKLASLTTDPHGNQLERVGEKRDHGLVPAPELPELLQLERSLAELDRHLNEILDATNAIEDL